MKKMVFIVVAIWLLVACGRTNDAQMGRDARTEVDDRLQTEQLQWRDRGLGVQKIGAHTNEVPADIVPSEPDMEREEHVLRIVEESEKYIGVQIDNRQFVSRVLEKAGYGDSVIDVENATPIHVPSTSPHVVWTLLQPGDLVYFDINGDGTLDHYCIKLGNGDVIHSYTDGKVVVTDMMQEIEWLARIRAVQRLF